MIPIGRISDPGVAEFGREAQDFLSGKPWCKKVGEGYLAWAIAGVVGVFLFRLIPTRDDVDETLWVVVGDLPPAYLVCDNAADWHQALECYCREMQKWVTAVTRGTSLDSVIPVNAPPTLEYATMLESRLRFIRDRIVNASPQKWESDK